MTIVVFLRSRFEEAYPRQPAEKVRALAEGMEMAFALCNAPAAVYVLPEDHARMVTTESITESHRADAAAKLHGGP